MLSGANTEMGDIASDLGGEQEKTPLQQKLDEFGEQLSKVIAVICVVVWLMNIGHFTDPDHGSWIKGAIYYFKIAVALAVAAIPEGLPAVVTTCLALGTMKMAKKNAIVRSLPSVETLGCTTVICSDKTGTLTTNMMSVVKLQTVSAVTSRAVEFNEYTVEGDSWSPIGRVVPATGGNAVTGANDSNLTEVSKISALCNEANLSFSINPKDNTGAFSKTGAPTEAALLVLAEKIQTSDSSVNNSFNSLSDENQRCTATRRYWANQLAREQLLEFDNIRKSMSVIVTDKSKQTYLLCKGTAEAVLDRCTQVRASDGRISTLSDSQKADIKRRMDDYGREGLRCLSLAYKPLNNFTRIDNSSSENCRAIESSMVFVGFSGMLDPPRAAVNASILKCRTAGIRVIVITGDQRSTAESIARRIGVFEAEEDLTGKSFTGSEFQQMNEQQKFHAVQSASLFCGVIPKHKLELVTLLQKQGEVVAMTGDGVNDATALRQADIGIAMGSGTDVAREASKMVLQDDNFATIVMAVEEGRSIYANTKQFIRYLISSNIGEVACIFLTAALGMPEALIPVQLLWVNLVTDGLPATALGFNPPDKDIMSKEPRGRTESIINGWMFFRYLAIGLYVGIGTVGGFVWWYLYASRGPHISWNQLTHFHDCPTDKSIYPVGFNCGIFHDQAVALPSTMSLSILVTIEMFNALNALSENQSLLSVTPLSNIYVLLACTLSMLLHFAIIYIPFFANIFHVAPLNSEEWQWVIYLSLPIFLLDEVLKAISRLVTSGAPAKRAAIKKTQ
jgi:Ca2+ transporting ATPase